MGFQAQFGYQSAAANAQAQIQAMNGNFNGGYFFGTPTFALPAFNNGIKGPFGVASPMMSDPSAGYNSFGMFQSASGPVRMGTPTYGTPTITSSNFASVTAALAGVTNVPGVGAPVSGLPPGATNLGPSSLIPGAFISGIKYGAAY